MYARIPGEISKLKGSSLRKPREGEEERRIGERVRERYRDMHTYATTAVAAVATFSLNAKTAELKNNVQGSYRNRTVIGKRHEGKIRIKPYQRCANSVKYYSTYTNNVLYIMYRLVKERSVNFKTEISG